jgi:flagellar protein FlbD
MIKLSRLNGKEFVLNADLIEQIEATPDTVITLTNGKTVMVAESADQVIKKVLKYRRLIQGFRRITKKNSKSANS